MTFVPTAGSLFSGAGMMDYAFAQAGFDIRFQVEIDPYCRKVLSKHAPTYWPNAELHADVRDVREQQLGYVDVLFGGFPCQSISNAGTRAGIQTGTASGLWYEFARLIGDIRPKVVLLENVAAITQRDGIKVITDLASLGYDARWGVISASDAGAPHQRDRWFCVGYANGERCQECDSPTFAPKETGETNPERFSQDEMEYPHSKQCEEYNVATRGSERDSLAGDLARMNLRQWTTPTANDSKKVILPETEKRPSLAGKMLAMGLKEDGLRINPSWVEQLMGYPDGWTDIS